MTSWCMPWWHDEFTRLQQDTRKVTNCPARSAAGDGYPVSGYVPCDPEALRQQAEQALIGYGAWSGHLPLDVYALARNMHSEQSQGTVEEWVVIGESAMNEARSRGTTVAKLLLYNQYGVNAFGDLNPQGRWASSRFDPTVGEVLIAAAILDGQTDNFSRGATSYIDPDEMGGEDRLMRWVGDRFTSGRWAWVGQLPNVPLRRTFAMRETKSITSQEMLDNQQALEELRTRNNLPAPTTVCSKPGFFARLKPFAPVLIVAAIGTVAALAVSYTMSEEFPRRWKIWKG